MRPITLVDGVCGKTAPDLMSARVPLFVETATQRPQVARERVRREVAWHLDKPLLEVAPPQKRVAQEEYRRPPTVCNPIVAMTSSELVRIKGANPTAIPTNVPIPVRSLSERLIESVDDTTWGMSRLIISDPKRLDDPEIAGKAKAEMMRFNAHSVSSGRVSGKFETGISVAEMFASFGNPDFGRSRQSIPNIQSLISGSSNPLQPDWNSAFAGGVFERIRGLIQSNYADTSRPSLKTAVRHWARFCAKLGISVFRPQVADNWEAKVMEEMILMMFLEYLLFEVRVQGSTCESYFSLMKGWHGEEMGYQPSSSGMFTSVWISKMLRGARRNFPSKFAEREAHSVTLFQKFRRPYAHWFFIKEFFVPHEELSTEGVAMLRTFLASIDWFDFLAEVVLEAMVVCLLRIGEALPTKLLPKKLCRDDIKFVYKDGKLLETVIRIYPLKQSVRARKAGQKIPIVIPANAGPYLMTAELLWLMVAADPTVGDGKQMPMFRKASKLAVAKARSNPRGDGQVTHDWLLKQYRRKLSENGMDPAKVPLFKLHSPRIIGATTMFASGKVTDMHLKGKGRWSSDIAYIYARFCPDMDRNAVRAIGCTDASPFMENTDALWATIAAWNEDAADLGDAEEFDEGDEALSDDEDEDEDS